MRFELLWLVWLGGGCHGLLHTRPRVRPLPGGPDYGQPLFLTPYIEAGNISSGQQAAIVKPFKAKVESFSGYLTVNPSYNSNMFFWYFPAEKDPDKAPVVLWLQGGPGASSLYGLFEEIGPFYVKKKRGLKTRRHYWSQLLNVIFIDNPVGTGFSFTENDKGYARDETQVGRDLYNALIQFFTLFPKLQSNEFYVAGESYAGKYVPAVAYTIHQNNPSSKLKINLKGISIGDGLCAPEYMMAYSDYLYQIGLIDLNAKYAFKTAEDNIRSLIKQSKWDQAFDAFDRLLNGDLTPYKSLFFNTTGFSFYFNFLHSKDESPYGDLGAYLEKDIIRRSIHVGNLTFNDGRKVETMLKQDVMQSVKPLVEVLVDNYRVLFYNGQLDIIVAYPLTVNFLQNLKWSGAGAYKTAQRKPWYVGEELAGYAKAARGLTEVLVRDAGHMVPQDQPLWALDLIHRFTSNKPFYP